MFLDEAESMGWAEKTEQSLWIHVTTYSDLEMD